MRKLIFLAAVSSNLLFAQGTWNGTQTDDNVGIGIYSYPTIKLHVNGDTKLINGGSRNLLIESEDQDSWLTFHDPGQHWYSMGIDKSDGGLFKLNPGGDLNSGNHFIMNSSGCIGIGTNPGFKLDVEGFGVRFKNSATSLGAYTTFRMQGPDYTHGLEIDVFGNNNITSDLNWSYGGGPGSAAIVNVNPKPLTFGTNNQGRMLIDSNGNVGIGTSNPQSLLSIFKGSGVGKNTDGLDGSLLYLNNGNLADGSIVIKSHGYNQVIGALKFHSSPDNVNYSQAAIKALSGVNAEAVALAFYTSTSNSQQAGNEVMRIQGNNVGIGTTDPGSFKLAVNGKVWAQEVQVALTNPGPDYVFSPNYKLLSLEEIKAYIDQHKHLPEVPSAKEMETNGVNVSEMNMLLLRKIEELTLHLIEQNKIIAQLQEERRISPDTSGKKIEELTLHVIELKKELNDMKTYKK